MKNSTVVAGGGAIDVYFSVLVKSGHQLHDVYGVIILIFLTADGDKQVLMATCTEYSWKVPAIYKRIC